MSVVNLFFFIVIVVLLIFIIGLWDGYKRLLRVIGTQDKFINGQNVYINKLRQKLYNK